MCKRVCLLRQNPTLLFQPQHGEDQHDRPMASKVVSQNAPPDSREYPQMKISEYLTTAQCNVQLVTKMPSEFDLKYLFMSLNCMV